MLNVSIIVGGNSSDPLNVMIGEILDPEKG